MPDLDPNLLRQFAAKLLDLYPLDEAEAAVRKPPDLPLLDWAQRFIPSAFAVKPSPFHAWLANTLDGLKTRRAVRLNVLAPRGAAKSSWASLAYPLREALEGRERFIVLVSDTSGQAKSFLRKIRQAIEDEGPIAEEYRRVVGKGDIWKDNHIRLRNGVEILALGTGGKIRGRASSENIRPSLIICDDLQNKEHIVSGLQRERSWEWLTKDALSAGHPETNIVVLGTALHRECIVCKLQQTPGWESRLWQAVVRWPKRMDLWREWESILHDYDKDNESREAVARAFFDTRQDSMTAGSEVLWPEREPLYDLMLHRATVGDAAFQCEKQNLPVDPATCEWPAELFEHPALWFDRWPTDCLVRTIGVDPSKGKSDKRGDYSAIVMYGRTGNGLEYKEADLARRSVEQMCHDLVERAREFKPDGIAIETNQFQELLLIPLQQAAAEAGIELPIYRVDNTTNKMVRIRRLGGAITQKRMRLKSRSPGTMELYNQLRDFPNAGHDDGPDAAEMARRLAVELCNGGKVKGFKR